MERQINNPFTRLDSIEFAPRADGVHRSIARSVMMRRGEESESEHPAIEVGSKRPEALVGVPPSTNDSDPRSSSTSTARLADREAEPSQKPPPLTKSKALPSWMLPTRDEEGDTLVSGRSSGSASGGLGPEQDEPRPVEVNRGNSEAERPPSRTHTYGGGKVGQTGVTPVEISSFHSSHTHAATRRLVNAITDYVDERLARHLAESIRQGILPR